MEMHINQIIKFKDKRRNLRVKKIMLNYLDFPANTGLIIPGYDTLDVSLDSTSSNKNSNISHKKEFLPKLTEAPHGQKVNETASDSRFVNRSFVNRY